MQLNKKLWLTIHNTVSAFFLPLALIFAVTGALYLLGLHGTVKEQNIPFQADDALMQNPGALTAAVKSALEANRIKMPAGAAEKMRDGYFWGKRAGVSVYLFPAEGGQGYELVVNTAGWYDRLLMAHKGKAGEPLKIFSILFSIALLLAFFTGIYLTWKNSPSRRISLLAMALGLVVTIALLVLSR